MRIGLVVFGTSCAAAIVAAAIHHGGSQAAAHGLGPAAQSDTLTTMYDVGGVKVIQRRSPTGEIVAARVYLLGGSRQVDETTAGIEQVLLTASEYGTRSYPGAGTRSAMSRTGSRIQHRVGPDWSSLGFVGLAEDFDSTWSVIADRLMHPTLDSAAVALARQRTLASLASRANSPEATARQLAESLAFAGHPYANAASGTVSAVSAMTTEMVRDYHAAHMVSSRLLLVVAGNVSRQQVERAVGETLAKLPPGSYTWNLPPRWQPRTAAVALRQQQLTTNYIAALFGGPAASSSDLAAFDMGVSLLGIISGPMRDSGLSYAAGTSFLNRGAAGGGITVSTGSPDRALKIINGAIDFVAYQAQLNPTAISARMLNYVSEHALNMETSDEQVNMLAEAHLFQGNYRYYEGYATVLRQVSPSDIARALRAYVKNLQYGYVGDTTQAPRAAMLKY